MGFPLRRRIFELLEAYLGHGIGNVGREKALSMRRSRGFALIGLAVILPGGAVLAVIIRSPAIAVASVLTMLFIMAAIRFAGAWNGRFFRPATHAAIAAMFTATIGSSIVLGYASPIGVTLSVLIIMATNYILGVRASVFWTGASVIGVGYAVLTSEPIPLPEDAIRPSLPVIFCSRALVLMGACAIAAAERRFSDRQSRELEVLAAQDPLTGLLNRRAFGERLAQAIARASRHGRRVGLIFLDLDDFKRVNDAHGHAAGDALLREVAERIASITREGDAAGRAGGDEFVMLLEDVGEPKNAALIAERLLARISEYDGPLVHPDWNFGASVGVACFPDDSDDAGALMHASDLAMYRAKSDGGHAVRMPA
jgi:diguanylate cyclase (GGDEF)-like protein